MYGLIPQTNIPQGFKMKVTCLNYKIINLQQGVVGRGMSRTALIVDATVSPAATVAGQGTKRFIEYKYPTIVHFIDIVWAVW